MSVLSRCCPFGKADQQETTSSSNCTSIPQLLAQIIWGVPASLLYRKTQACPLPPFHISITLSLGIKAAVRPAAISNFLILLRLISGCSKRDVRASVWRFFQGTTFEVCSLVGQKVIKKSLASTRKAADKFLRERLASERVRPKDRFLRWVDLSGQRSSLKSSKIYKSWRVLGKLPKIRLW